MKRLILTVSLSCVICVGAFSQTSQEVSFIHGLDGSYVDSWNYMANQLNNEFIFSIDPVNYNTAIAISTAASNIYLPANTVVIAHSMGGLVSREYIRQHNTGRVKALITVGTPNTGAPIAANVQNGVAASVISHWLAVLAQGPIFTLGGFDGTDFAEDVLQYIGIITTAGGAGLQTFLSSMYGSEASVDNMIPNSSFMNTLNANPEITLPSARYAIYGSEELYDYVRLMESKITGGVEDGTAIKAHHAVSAVYFVVAAIYSFLAIKYLIKYYNTDPYTDPFHDDYYDDFLRYSHASTLWFRGFLSLIILQQKQWDELIVDGFDWHVEDGELVRESSDAILPYSTQAPFFFRKFDNVDRRLVALGANHLEETVHPSVKQRLFEIFNNSDVDINERTDGGDPIDPPEFPEPCYDENGNQIICPTYN